ncbi:hypothetical protein ABE945_06395 [Enterococcus gilvus]
MKKRLLIVACCLGLLVIFFMLKINIHIRIILVLATMLYLLIDGTL